MPPISVIGRKVNIDNMVNWIVNNKLPQYGNQVCATHVRQALEAGNFDTSGRTLNAKDWGPGLEKAGFEVIGEGTVRNPGNSLPDGYIPKKGDIIIYQPGPLPPGHIQIYAAPDWYSDHRQNTELPKRSGWEGAPYRIYRYGGAAQ